MYLSVTEKLSRGLNFLIQSKDFMTKSVSTYKIVDLSSNDRKGKNGFT